MYCILDLDGEAEPVVFSRHRNQSSKVRGLAFHADGTRLLALQGDHVEVIDAVSGRSLKEWPNSGGTRIQEWCDITRDGLRVLALSPDASGAFRVFVQDLTNGEFRSTIPGLFSHASLSPDGQRIACIAPSVSAGDKGEQRECTLWDAASAEEITSLPIVARENIRPTFSPDGKSLVGAHPAGGLAICSVRTDGTVLRRLYASESLSSVRRIRFDPSGHRVLANTRVYDTASGSEMMRLDSNLDKHYGGVADLYGAAGILLSTRWSLRVLTHETGFDRRRTDAADHSSFIYFQRDRDETPLLFTWNETNWAVRDGRTGSSVSRGKVPDGFAFGDDRAVACLQGTRILLEYVDPEKTRPGANRSHAGVFLIDVSSGQTLERLPGRNVVLDPRGELVIMVQDDSLHVYSCSNGAIRHKMRLPESMDARSNIVFSGDGGRLVLFRTGHAVVLKRANWAIDAEIHDESFTSTRWPQRV